MLVVVLSEDVVVSAADVDVVIAAVVVSEYQNS